MGVPYSKSLAIPPWVLKRIRREDARRGGKSRMSPVAPAAPKVVEIKPKPGRAKADPDRKRALQRIRSAKYRDRTQILRNLAKYEKGEGYFYQLRDSDPDPGMNPLEILMSKEDEESA